MIVSMLRASCDAPACPATAAAGSEGWLDLGDTDLCPRHAKHRLLAAGAAIEALALPLPSLRALVASRGTVRRLQALVARGWSLATLRTALGLSRPKLEAHMLADEVPLEIAQRVTTLYRRLQHLEPPRTSVREEAAYAAARSHAKALRWLPPAAWDDIDRDEAPPVPDEAGAVDEMVVELAVAGMKPRLTVREREAAIRRLHGMRHGDPVIARVIGCTDRTVFRTRERLGLPGIPRDQQADYA